MAVLCTIGLAIVASVFLIPSADYYGRDMTTYRLTSVPRQIGDPAVEAKTIAQSFNMKPYVEENFCDSYYEFEFAGYKSWAEFASHCCCTRHNDVDIRDPEMQVEMWRCDNGKRRQRYRVLNITVFAGSNNAVQVSGLDIRGFCSSEFAANVRLDDAKNCVGVKYVLPSFVNGTTANSTIQPPKLWNYPWPDHQRAYLPLWHTEFARYYLW